MQCRHRSEVARTGRCQETVCHHGSAASPERDRLASGRPQAPQPSRQAPGGIGRPLCGSTASTERKQYASDTHPTKENSAKISSYISQQRHSRLLEKQSDKIELPQSPQQSWQARCGCPQAQTHKIACDKAPNQAEEQEVQPAPPSSR